MSVNCWGDWELKQKGVPLKKMKREDRASAQILKERNVELIEQRSEEESLFTSKEGG